MKKTFFMILFLVACNPNEPMETNTNKSTQSTIKSNKTFTILALGDSLTEGLGVAQEFNYPSILATHLPANIQVINAGLSGETTSGLKNRLNWVLKQKPDLTILNIGANDAMRGLPMDLTKANIDEIITSIQQSGSDVILAGMQIYNNLGKQYVQDFANIYPELAQKHAVPLIPFFLEHVAGKPIYNQNDMLHPNAKGYAVIVEKNVLPIVQQYLNTKNL